MSAGRPPHLRPQEPSGLRGGSLRERLEEVAGDRAASAREVVLETAGVVGTWLAERPEADPLDGARLEHDLAPWAEDQAWRGPCAGWLDSMRLAWREADPGRERAALALEASAWGAGDGDPSRSGRMPERADLAERAAVDVGRGETVLVTAWSESVALALEAAWRLGRRPAVLLVEGHPSLDGRRMARRLSRAGVAVTLAYDAALLALVPRADRVWLSSEAVGAGAFLARTGTTALLEECARVGVPARVLATSDKLMPGGALRAPSWPERERWMLWEDAPEGVVLESQCYEPVPLDLAGSFLTEVGLESASALHLRALRVDAAPPCSAPRPSRATIPS